MARFKLNPLKNCFSFVLDNRTQVKVKFELLDLNHRQESFRASLIVSLNLLAIK